MRGEGKLLIKNGRVIDPANNIDAILDVAIDKSKITKVADNIALNGYQVIDAKAKIVMPAIVDMHVHLREPGREDKETVNSGTKAAAKGGVGTLLAMPNTSPAADSAENVKRLKEIIKQSAVCNVLIAGAITKERLGQEVVDIAKLKKEGVIAITDDGTSVDDADLMLTALKTAHQEAVVVLCHCEETALSAGGMVNLGLTSTRMGLRGISRESEYKRVERDINLAEKAQASVHITHVSCQESLDLVAQAKKKGLRVTCDTAPHYFTLSEEAVLGYDTNMKINPPLRRAKDVQAIIEGLRNGTIDAIASDHAPHTDNDKDIEFERAEFGSTGLETELALVYTQLVDCGLLSWPDLVKRMSLNPARILGIDKGSLGIGKDADVIIVDPDKEWVVAKEGFVSKSKNSAFLGRKLKGVVEYTICGGEIVYEAARCEIV